MACTDNSVGALVSDLDCNIDKQAKTLTVVNDTCSNTNVGILVINLTDNFTIKEPRAKKLFSRIVNLVTGPKSNGQTCIDDHSTIALYNHNSSQSPGI